MTLEEQIKKLESQVQSQKKTIEELRDMHAKDTEMLQAQRISREQEVSALQKEVIEWQVKARESNQALKQATDERDYLKQQLTRLKLQLKDKTDDKETKAD